MNPKVAAIVESFPIEIQKRLLEVREMILSLESELDEMERVEETVKWGEPSYTTLGGSTVRLGWKANAPDTFAVYFHCQTKLVETFRQVYPEAFRFEGNRAILLGVTDPIPNDELKHCLLLALTYHKRKHLPLLGVEK